MYHATLCITKKKQFLYAKLHLKIEEKKCCCSFFLNVITLSVKKYCKETVQIVFSGTERHFTLILVISIHLEMR